jgi:hypothetical protein
MSFTQGRVGECPIACFGYSTTDNKTSSGAPILFGQRQVEQGHCLAPFFDYNRPDQVLGTEAYAIVGKEIKPSTCHTRMRIVRRYAALDNAGEPVPVSPEPSFPSGEGAPPSVTRALAENLPIKFRMIRCTPKGAKGTTEEVVPNKTLFLDKYGNPISVGDPDFNENEVEFLSVNRRKWTVLEDKKFMLQNPLTLQWTFQRINASNTGFYTPQISNTNSNCEKVINMHHTLTSRKNGTVHYNTMNNGEGDEDRTTNATSGMRREYVFIMAYYKGATDLIGGDLINEINPVNQIRLNLYNSTTFTDV